MQKYNLFYLYPTTLSKILSLQMEKMLVFRGESHEIHEQKLGKTSVCDHRYFCRYWRGLPDETVLASST